MTKLILTALIILTGCCKTITERTTVTVTDSSAVKSLQVQMQFKTDSIDKIKQEQLKLRLDIEALDSLLYLYGNEPDPVVKDSIKTVIINQAKFEPLSGSLYGFGTFIWSMTETGLFEAKLKPADTLLTDSAKVTEYWHKTKTETIRNIDVVRNSSFATFAIWFFWLLIVGSGIGFLIKYFIK